MKGFILDFIRRGFTALGIGPLVLAAVYFLVDVQTLTGDQVCIGIVSLSALAFVAGGMNAIYQVERIPLMIGILIHGTVLYIGYLGVYLLNGWLERGMIPVMVFTGIFVVGYLVIWAIIYSTIKRNTESLNAMLKQNRESKA